VENRRIAGPASGSKRSRRRAIAPEDRQSGSMGRRGPFESWLAALLDRAMARSEDIQARVASVDLSATSRLGEARAYIAFERPADPDRAAWRWLAEALSRDPAIERAVAVPPAIHVTLASGVLETGVTRSVKQEPLIPQSHEVPGVVVVFCSPNTNKPLHIGHLRACFLGMSISRLFEATGVQVARSQMLSNFGIHMCQALAVHDGVTDPRTAGVKGDHYVGELYRAYHAAVAQSDQSECDDRTCRAGGQGHPCIRCRPSHLLRQMSGGDSALLEANRRLGEWAIQGILATQAQVGTTHDTCLRESEVIALAVNALDRAVEAGVCKRRPDGSTYIPVRSTGETELTLLRRDGTSLVFSMLLGIYLTRGELYPGWQVVELTGEQWRAGRTAMYEVLRRIGKEELAATTEGTFFGMVQLEGQVMQSRKGTVVLADALVDGVAERVRGWEECPEGLREDASARVRLAVALLKYHILRFSRPEGFSFDEEVMWTDATKRLSTVLRALRWAELVEAPLPGSESHPEVRSLALAMARHSAFARRALAKRDPAILVRYTDDVAEKSLTAARRDAATPEVRGAVSYVLRRSLYLLGIEGADLGLGASSHRAVSAASPA